MQKQITNRIFPENFQRILKAKNTDSESTIFVSNKEKCDVGMKRRFSWKNRNKKQRKLTIRMLRKFRFDKSLLTCLWFLLQYWTTANRDEIWIVCTLLSRKEHSHSFCRISRKRRGRRWEFRPFRKWMMHFFGICFSSSTEKYSCAKGMHFFLHGKLVNMKHASLSLYAFSLSFYCVSVSANCPLIERA
jgi:hypothetical protein